MEIYLAVFFIALVVSLVLTPVAIRLSKKLGIMAMPGGRRQHGRPVPKLGGFPVTIAYLVGIFIVYLYLPPVGDDSLRLRGIVIGSLIFFAGGLIDDIWELPPWVQFAIQFLGAGIAMAHIVFIEVFTNPISGKEVWVDWRPLAYLITLLWIVGIVNSVNFLDGLDGLAAGVGTIAALVFAWHSIRLGQEAVAAFPLAMAGALLGFLPFNFAPSRIFLGSAGAYILGYNLATLSILSPAKIATALLVLAIPIIDGVWRAIDRIRQGRSPFQGDRGHLHFRLADQGVPTRWIVLGYYGLSLAFGLVALFAPGLLKLILLIILSGLLVSLLVWFSHRTRSKS